jgi:SAM-dependent MidA family methyltransferase
MLLSDIIIGRIQKEGPLAFRDFMEMALYYPGEGYYTSGRQKIGKSGDYYTSAYLTGLFGEMLAVQLEEMWQALGRQPFTIVEYGAGTGLLCRDILRRLKENKEMYEDLRYYIIEKSDTMRQKEEELLQQEEELLPEKVRWVTAIADIAPVTGCILSNELVDNFSVHQVLMAAELMEVCVSYDGDFTETLRPAAPALKEYLHQLQVELPVGYRAEIDLEATDWIQEVARALDKGFVLTVDYGYPSSTLYSKRSGTLACYNRHKVSYCPYDRIGDQDITHHVNFSALDYWGRRSGLDCCGYTRQIHFLQGLGLTRCLRKWEEAGMEDPVARQQQFHQLQTLLMDMGHKFKVLIQRKGLDRVFLSGLQFPQPLV